MRLTPDQHDTIMRVVRDHAGEEADVFLYGSRTQDDRRGGDVDLLVHSPHVIDTMRQAALHAQLEEALRLPVDISFVDARRGMTRFQKLVAAQALPLGAAR
jgi:predicted nucleotidyltransferase